MKRTVLVVGPGAAFGEELCKALLQEHHVVTCSRRRTDLPNEVVQKQVDIAQSEFVVSLQQLLATHEVSGVVYAPKFSPKGGLDLESQELMRSYQVNDVGILPVLQALKHTERKGPTAVVVLGGGYKDVPHPNKIALSSSKAALHNMILALQDDYLAQRIVLHELVIDGRIGAEDDVSPHACVKRIQQLLKKKQPTIMTLPKV